MRTEQAIKGHRSEHRDEELPEPIPAHHVSRCVLGRTSRIESAGSHLAEAGRGRRYFVLLVNAAAMQASIAMLAALHARGSSPDSIYLDISIAESILSWQYLPILTNTEERAESLLNGGAACYNIYQCADERFISLGAIETGFWENFCAALQKPQWIAQQYASMPQHALIAEVAEQISKRSLDYWHQLLDAVDCCYAPLLAPAQLPANPQLQARRSLSESGPHYPGWINDEVVEINELVTEVEHPQSLSWRPL